MLAACAAPPRQAQFRLAAEFEPQAAVWMSAQVDDPDFMRVTADMVRALQPHVRVRMLVRDEATAAKTRELLRQQGVDGDDIQFAIDARATFFLRDAAVYLIDGQGGLGVLDLQWSLYGLPGWLQRLYPGDPERAARYAGQVDMQRDDLDRSMARRANATLIAAPICLENACIEVNGRGVLLISEPLALERNPGRSRDELERQLLALPGITKVIWLGDGLAQDPLELSTISGDYVGLGAGGHTDEFVRFADAHTVLLAWIDDAQVEAHPLHRINRARMQQNFDLLEHATDQDGRPFRVVKVPLPNVIERKTVLAAVDDASNTWSAGNFPASEGRQGGDAVIQVAAATYLNFLIANDLVLVPSYIEDGTPADLQERVRLAFVDAFPGRSIRFLRVTPLNWDGGGLHCATLSEPRAVGSDAK